MHVRCLAAAALALTVASCDRPAAPGDTEPASPSSSAPAFSHAMTSDLSGYYMPVGEVRAGKWRLDHLFVGQAAEFRSWEAGRRSETFGPVMLQFDDVTSPMTSTELGETHSVTARVLPLRYAVSETAVSFEGRSPELGRVIFEGRLDPDALATARRNLGGDGVVVTGTLTAGGRTIDGVRMTWWMGD